PIENNHTPPTMRTMPARRAIWRPKGATFSRRMSNASRTIQSTFITPPTSNSASGIHRGYIRVFNNGNHPKFDWNMGGRLYSYREFNYQQLDGKDRLKMTINDEPVCETDIRASYLTIFYALYDEPFDPTNDPYDVPGLGPEVRDVVKMWVTASFGNNAPITKWPKELVAKYREKTGRTLGKRYSASKVAKKVLQAFPLLTRLGEIADGKERGWAELMYLESRAMFETMNELMREQIPSLAVHDSIIVPCSNQRRALASLRKWYQGSTLATPVLVSHFPEGYKEPPPPPITIHDDNVAG